MLVLNPNKLLFEWKVNAQNVCRVVCSNFTNPVSPSSAPRVLENLIYRQPPVGMRGHCPKVFAVALSTEKQVYSKFLEELLKFIIK